MIQFSYDEVSRIVKASKSTVENNKKYQMFHKGFLQKIWIYRLIIKFYSH